MDPEKDYFLRPYQPGDEVHVVEHLRKSFNGWPRFDLDCSAVEHWRWKFLENPFHRFICSLAFSNGKVIASHHNYPFKIKIDNAIFTGGNAVDFAVNAGFRRRGISKQVSQLTSQSEHHAHNLITFWMSMNQIIIKTHRAQKNDFLYDIIRLIKIKDVNMHLKKRPTKNAWIKKIGYSTIKFVGGLRSWMNKAALPSDINMTTINRFDGRFVEFWDEIKNIYSFILERTPDLVNWRYCDYRGGIFIIRAAERDGRILGYSVLRINKKIKDYPEGYIVDLLALPDSAGVADVLVSDALSYFDEKNVNVIRCLCFKDQPLDKILKRHNFFESPEEIGLFYNAKDPVMEKLKKIRENPESKIHYVYGDTDWI